MGDFIDFLQTLLGYITNDPTFLVSEYKKTLDIPFAYLLYGENAFASNGSILAFTSDSGKMTSILLMIYDVILPIGILLICISLFMRVIELIIMDKAEKEILIKDVLMALAVILILGNGPSIVGGFYYQVSQLTEGYFEEIETIADNGKDSFKEMYEMIEQADEEDKEAEDGFIIGFIKKVMNSIWSVIMGLISTLLTMILNVLVTIILTYVAIVRAVKLGLHITFMPIAMGDLYANQNHTRLTHYGKKLIALFLQEYVILFDIVILTVLVSPFDLLETLLKFGIILITITTSESTAKQLIGAR